ncbi:MAG: 4'-phosphopantetheinyl transferase [Pasteurellales bacterium]|nr:MAG: 4'-phosphopantetheinyl transferase [Pasteurellales bacterium]
MESDRLEIIFAHNDEYLWANNIPAVNFPVNSYQLNKWKSRQTAMTILNILFEKYQLDKALLNSIQRTENGRPFVHHPYIDFNISHSGEWVAVIFCYSKTKKVVAIDIEHPQKIRRYEALLNYYTRESEKEFLLKDPNKLEENFYLSWCLREAVLKSQGVGIIKLSEVKHSPLTKEIYCHYCPTGTLHFCTQLPFYLCYFFENQRIPTILKLQKGILQKIDKITPLIYNVNKEKYE